MRSSTNENIDALFNWHKVKFSKMEVLFGDVAIQEVINTVNVFINIESIYHLFHNQYIEDAVISMDKAQLRSFHSCIIANTLNLAAHYRWFFTKNKIATNIVFYMSQYSKYTNQNNFLHNKHYREKYVYDYTDNPNYEGINSVMSSVLRALDNIVDYVNGVYFISSDRIESSLIPMVITEEKMTNGQLNLIITRDRYDLQYVNKKYLVLYPKGEESVIVTNENLFEILRTKHYWKTDYKLPSYLFSFMLAVIGDTRRNLTKVKGISWKSLYKKLAELFDSMDISDDEIVSFEQLAVSIKEDPAAPVNNRKLVIDNYMCIDLDRQYAMVSNPQKMDIERQIIDRYEGNALKDLNDKYFKENPINIIELNQYSSNRKRKKIF